MMRSQVPAALLVLALASACTTESESPSAVGRDRPYRVSDGLLGSGAQSVRPHDWTNPPVEEDYVPEDPTEEVHPVLPAADLAKVQVDMTAEELEALLGPPHHRTTRLVGIDREGDSFNAIVYTWKYQDPRYTTMELTRDFEVRLAQVEHARPLASRPEVVGPTLVVVDWNLF